MPPEGSGPGVIDAAGVAARLDYPALVERIESFFRDGCVVPVRHHHIVDMADEAEATLLLMPAWRVGDVIGVKVASVFPDNANRDLPSIFASMLLLDGHTGKPRALIEGGELTVRRTAAASALAARFLARADAAHHLMVGTGAMAPHLIRAHATQRPIRRVSLWGRNPDKAARLANVLKAEGLPVEPVEDLAAAVPEADIVSCATLSNDPLVCGDWLRPGQHLDLVGAFNPAMRESDDEAVLKSQVYVDTRAGALVEGGDIVDPLKRGIITKDHIRGDLFELCRGETPGRQDDDAITLFKSVGTALEDLAAAQLVSERL